MDIEALLEAIHAQIRKTQAAQTSEEKCDELSKVLLLMKQLGEAAEEQKLYDFAQAVMENMQEFIQNLQVTIH